MAVMKEAAGCENFSLWRRFMNIHNTHNCVTVRTPLSVAPLSLSMSDAVVFLVTLIAVAAGIWLTRAKRMPAATGPQPHTPPATAPSVSRPPADEPEAEHHPETKTETKAESSPSSKPLIPPMSSPSSEPCTAPMKDPELPAHQPAQLEQLEQGLQELTGVHSILEFALAVREAKLGPDHPSVAASLLQLGQLLDAQSTDGAAPEALPLYALACICFFPPSPHASLDFVFLPEDIAPLLIAL